MSWRVIVIEKRCKLDLKMNYMVVRSEDTVKVFLDEIGVLIIENPAVSMTVCLLNALTEKKVKVIFCDSKRNPSAELQPCYGCHDDSRKIRLQISWSPDRKGMVWTEIVAEKIRHQSAFVRELGHDQAADLLDSYLSELRFNDESNREGHAAKVYFNALFGMDFTRSDENIINAALNYGYGLILSAVNREVSLNGYLTQIGIFHDNVFNHFNLSCDLMEPIRIVIDRFVKKSAFTAFGTEEKRMLLSVLNDCFYINGVQNTLLNAIKIYVRSVFDAINEGDASLIKFIKFV